MISILSSCYFSSSSVRWFMLNGEEKEKGRSVKMGEREVRSGDELGWHMGRLEGRFLSGKIRLGKAFPPRPRLFWVVAKGSHFCRKRFSHIRKKYEGKIYIFRIYVGLCVKTKGGRKGENKGVFSKACPLPKLCPMEHKWKSGDDETKG